MSKQIGENSDLKEIKKKKEREQVLISKSHKIELVKKMDAHISIKSLCE